MFTDLLLVRLTEDEIEGVFGHEVGHVKHGHLLYYAAFLILSFLTLGAIYQAIEQVPMVGRLEKKNAIMVLSVVGMGAYLFLAFGFVSRRCGGASRTSSSSLTTFSRATRAAAGCR